jgi:hypothetical protein
VRRIRSLLIALVALALSAGAVSAFRSLPSAAADGLATAGAAAGMTVPARPDAVPATRNQDRAEPDEDTGESSDESTAAAADVSAQATHPDNHGAAVSEAARTTTPGGFSNHGAYVSSIALDNAGQATAKEHRQTPTTPTPPTPTVPEHPAGH